MNNKRKKDEMYFKINSFHPSKNTIKKMKKKNPTEWQKIFVNYSFAKGLVFRMHEEFLELNNKKKKKTEEMDKNLDEKRLYRRYRNI